ncbi:hypothetical protein C8P67_102194 [Flavobacterium aquicola]|uniref:Uncharacterized protein n=1 Tax=Flavobacterium aquicola TaxID=1682742 RepID=A0A3E0ETF1_9FLAO|nr:hypothetical protein C8P67_102194 [Flavobacterium aquicola]
MQQQTPTIYPKPILYYPFILLIHPNLNKLNTNKKILLIL